MGRVEDVRDLDVYQRAFALQQRVFEASRAFPRSETHHWLHTAEACGYLDAATRAEPEQFSRDIGRMLGAMIRDADRWCSPCPTDLPTVAAT